MLLTGLDRCRTIFFGGKGGVGKTTCSAAAALALSRAGRRVLLVSTDPAHSTSDIFERHIGPDACELQPGLWAVEIDAQDEASRYIGEVKADIERLFSPGVVRQAHRQIEMAARSPGLLEVALLDRMIDLIAARDSYDVVVFDTAPTGHTLHLLQMPDAMDAWIHALASQRRALVDAQREQDAPDGDELDDDPILSALERRRTRLRTLRETLADGVRTAFILVAIPERLAIEETARASEVLLAAGLNVGGLIVNRILPESLEGDFYRSRKAQEQVYREEIDRRFAGLSRVSIRQLPRDVHGLESLVAISQQL